MERAARRRSYPARVTFVDRFDTLDAAVWTDAYLPAWSSRAEAAATWRVGPGGLELSIPPEQPLWCADQHAPPLRVSAVQSANRSGEVGSTDAPQPFLPGQTVREAQPTVLGFAPHYRRVAVTCSAELGPRSMFSAWMVGLEDEPRRCGEICLVEVFGDAVRGGRAAVGQGIHPFRDPALVEDFAAPELELDVSREHRYEVDWRPGRVTFLIDGVVTRESEQSPDYPLFLILGVFDFPERPGEASVPRLRVREVEIT